MNNHKGATVFKRRTSYSIVDLLVNNVTEKQFLANKKDEQNARTWLLKGEK
jgi:hypothetical protein